VSDGRCAQGRDHPVAVVLTLCAAAVLAGMGSFTTIAGWVADVPTDGRRITEGIGQGLGQQQPDHTGTPGAQ
jgi:hypothetical protein